MRGPIKKGRKPSKTAGRPRKEIDLHQLEKLCKLGCTQEEIARYCRVSPATVERWAASEPTATAMNAGNGRFKISIRREQFRLLRRGNASMAIWLGKQILGQKDKVENTLKTPPGDPLKLEHEVHVKEQALLLNDLFTPEQIAEAHQRLRERELAQAPASDHLN